MHNCTTPTPSHAHSTRAQRTSYHARAVHTVLYTITLVADYDNYATHTGYVIVLDWHYTGNTVHAVRYKIHCTLKYTRITCITRSVRYPQAYHRCGEYFVN